LIGVHLDQVLIVERGTGRILDRWSESSHFRTGNKKEIQQRAIAKMLVAICEFDKNPKAVFHGGLPVLDLGGSYAYLHATPVYILAAKYSGPAIDKLKRYIDSILQNSVRSAPNLLYFFGSKSGGLRGTAGQVASALEKLLLDANMPPYGEVRRPVFAYAAIAALSLVGITATGEAIVQKYVSAKVQGANELNRALTDFAPSAGAIVPPQMRIIAGDAGHAAQGGATALQPAAIAPGSAATATLGGLTPAQLLTWQLDRSLMRLPAAAGGVPGSMVDGVVEAALAKLSNFDWETSAKLYPLNRFDLSTQALSGDLAGAADLASRFSQDVPISLTDQGVKVGLFSTSSDESSIFAPGGTQPPASIVASASAGAGADGAVSANAAGAAIPAAAQTISNAASAVRGLAR